MVFTMTIQEDGDVSAQEMRVWFGDFGAEFVKSGFEVGEGTGLAATVTAGVAYVKNAAGEMFQVTSSATENVTVTDVNTNYIYLHCDNGSDYLTASTSASVPTDAIVIAEVVAADGDISSVTDRRIVTSNTNPTRLVLSYPSTGANQYIYLNPDLSALTKVGTLKVLTDQTAVVYFHNGTSETNLGTIGAGLSMTINRWLPADKEGYIKISKACTGVRLSVEMY